MKSFILKDLSLAVSADLVKVKEIFTLHLKNA